MINSWLCLPWLCPASLWTTCRPPAPARALPSLCSTTLPSTPRWGRETEREPPPARPPPPPSPPSSPRRGPVRRAAAVATPTWSSRPEVSTVPQYLSTRETNKTKYNIEIFATYSLHPQLLHRPGGCHLHFANKEELICKDSRWKI